MATQFANSKQRASLFRIFRIEDNLTTHCWNMTFLAATGAVNSENAVVLGSQDVKASQHSGCPTPFNHLSLDQHQRPRLNLHPAHHARARQPRSVGNQHAGAAAKL